MKRAQSTLRWVYNRSMKSRYIIGIDEVGRGPVAGPVTVGAVLFPSTYSWRNFRGLRDSKKLTPRKREEWFSKLSEMNDISFAVSSVGSRTIDKKGITACVQQALCRAINRLSVNPNECFVLLDGRLKAPDKFRQQKTIIRGDEKEYAIAFASVAAKVTRDNYMIHISKKYQKYDFHRHKGYGTKKHYQRIRKHGICDIHRRSFLSRFY